MLFDETWMGILKSISNPKIIFIYLPDFLPANRDFLFLNTQETSQMYIKLRTSMLYTKIKQIL